MPQMPFDRWSHRPEDPDDHEMLLWTMANHQYHAMLAWVREHPGHMLLNREIALTTAVYEEWTGAIEALVHVANLSVDVLMAGGGTLLHYATDEKKYQSMDLLLRLKVDPNAKDNQGNTALHHALRVNNFRAARKLIAHTDVNRANVRGELPLHLALKKNASLPLLKALVNRTTAWSQQDLDNGETPLILAVTRSSHPDILRPMMARGASESEMLRNTKGESGHDWLQRRSRFRRFADEGRAIYEQGVLRATLDASNRVPSDALTTEAIPTPEMTVRVRRRM